jgi:DNA-binding transcriptional LysR family regulator
VNGVIAATRAGLGVAIFARSLVPEELRELPAATALPRLGEIDLVLLTNPRAARHGAEALSSAILASGHPMRPRV